jgi:DNA sulfur modification protein DndD
VILIGGQNGFGKTSLFEAISLGLFGRDGLRLVQRAAAADDNEKRAASFKDFLQRALHTHALQSGRTSCRVGLIFEDENGDPIEVERTWHFTEGGQLRSGGNAETLRIMKGRDRKVVEPPRSEADPDGWYRDWIAHTFLPAHLAGFFLFDGEAASAYAERDMGVQVREGIEGLLGLTWLRRLAESLRTYAARRRSEVPRGVTTEAIEALEKQIETLETEVKQAEARLDIIAADLPGAEAKREALTRELASYGSGTHANLEDLIRQHADQEKQYQVANAELSRIAEMDLPLALSGHALRERLNTRLDQERRLEQWLAAAAETKERVESILQVIDEDLAAVVPPLAGGQSDAVRAAIRRALEGLWHPPPEGAADSFRHPHLTGPLRELARNRLDRAASVTSDAITGLLEAMANAAAALRDIKAAIDASQVKAPQLEEKGQRILELNTQIDGLRIEEGEKRNFISSRKTDITQKHAELARLTAQLDQSAKPARLAKRAEEVAAMLDALREEALPLQTGAIAEEMTGAIKAMAHRRDLFREVIINNEGEVLLLGPNGQNLRDRDLSAGEKQVFTQALFAAVAAVSKRVFPLVIDTPLGRLDEEHRLNVLRHLANRDSQVIMLSTNTEVVGPYLDAIRSRVACTFRIENKTEGDAAISSPVDGYFPGEGF